jgi:hypothetical protein
VQPAEQPAYRTSSTEVEKAGGTTEEKKRSSVTQDTVTGEIGLTPSVVLYNFFEAVSVQKKPVPPKEEARRQELLEIVGERPHRMWAMPSLHGEARSAVMVGFASAQTFYPRTHFSKYT